MEDMGVWGERADVVSIEAKIYISPPGNVMYLIVLSGEILSPAVRILYFKDHNILRIRSIDKYPFKSISHFHAY